MHHIVRSNFSLFSSLLRTQVEVLRSLQDQQPAISCGSWLYSASAAAVAAVSFVGPSLELDPKKKYGRP